MKNVIYLTKLRQLVKSMAVSFLFLVLGIAASSFTATSDNEGLKKSGRDSLQSGKNSFPSLFSTDNFDPAKPYVSQLNPKAVKFVHSYIQEYSNKLNRMKIWGKPYFDMYDGVLSQHGLPKELKYLSVIESSLKPGALSSAGALGPWQIMPGEARALGLKVNKRVDERRNHFKSTHAAARFLKDLYKQFNDWTLVIAAYNCGAGRLRQAIRKSGSKDFWDLQFYLPLETRTHVKKFIGTHYIFEGSGGLTTMTATELHAYNVNALTYNSKLAVSDEDQGKTMTAELNGKYNSIVICKNISMDLAAFNKLNPNFDKSIAKGGYTLKLPVDKMMLFDTKKQQILNETVQLLLK